MVAAANPSSVAVVEPLGEQWAEVTFAEMNDDATKLAHGLLAMGIGPGKRIALLVKPGIEFVTLVFALLRSGATMVLVDAGLGRKNIVRCLKSTQPDGFVAIPQGHALRLLMRGKFPNAKLNVTVGRRWCWGGETLASLRKLGSSPTAPTALPTTIADDPAAIVFTSGSTGPPKGVVYRHETFTTQCEQIQRQYDLQPGAVDLACFPLFGLFNVACGITTVLPQMDFSRPASCDPVKLFQAANDWKVSQSFASPAVWDRLSRHAEQTGERIPTLRKMFSCGAPVPAKVIRRTLAMVAPDAELHTPYGATESLPVATIEAQEILAETAAKTDEGAGVCVGRSFDNVDWRIIRITDDPIATIDQTQELPQGEIGELIVRAPQVSRQYLLNPFLVKVRDDVNQRSKIADDPLSQQGGSWHRIGDVGYFDEQQRFWYCGRKSQRVRHSGGDLFADQIEAIVNTIANVKKSALVGVDGNPVVVVEATDPDKFLETNQRLHQSVPLSEALGHARGDMHVLLHKKLPTDIRHNSKINRELLTAWAAKQLSFAKQASKLLGVSPPPTGEE